MMMIIYYCTAHQSFTKTLSEPQGKHTPVPIAIYSKSLGSLQLPQVSIVTIYFLLYEEGSTQPGRES